MYPKITEAAKIDSLATDGLEGVHDSLAYRVAEIERHLHSGGKWLEKAASPSGETHVADRIGEGAGAFQIDAGNDDWGSWVQIVGSEDTPITSGMLYFDPHELIVEDVETAATYFIQIGRGDSGAAALAAGTVTDLVYVAGNTKDAGTKYVQTGRAPIGSKLWARCKCPGQNTATLDFYLGLHEYEG